MPALSRFSLGVVALLACSESAPPGAEQAINKGLVISAGAASLHQQETTLARASNGRIVAVWIDPLVYPATTIGYSISDDDGQTWHPPAQLPIPPDVRCLGDPSVVADQSGTFTLVALGSCLNKMRIYSFRLGPGETAFGNLGIIDALDSDGTNNFDKPWIIRAGGGLLVTYEVVRANPVAYAAISSDGVTWKRDTIATNNPVLVAPCSDGPLVSAVYYRQVDASLWVASSADGGASWTTATQIVPAASSLGIASCVRQGNALSVFSTVAGNGQGIRMMHAIDAGLHFSTTATIDIGYLAMGAFASRSDGNIDAGYYQSSPGLQFGFVHSVLTPNGQLISREIVRNGLAFPTARFAQNDFADYVGIDQGRMVFVDNSSGTSHVSFYNSTK